MMQDRFLIQNPRRKMHLAAIYGPGTYATFCDRIVIQNDATHLEQYDAVGGATRRLVDDLTRRTANRDVCFTCQQMLNVIRLLESDRWLAGKVRS